jgi:hypothetical protein
MLTLDCERDNPQKALHQPFGMDIISSYLVVAFGVSLFTTEQTPQELFMVIHRPKNLRQHLTDWINLYHFLFYFLACKYFSSY